MNTLHETSSEEQEDEFMVNNIFNFSL